MLQPVGLFLKEEQVHVGMTVALCLEGKTEPERDEKGCLIFRALLGGVPMRRKFYPTEGIQWRPNLEPKPADPKVPHCPGVLIARSMIGFRSDVRFMPLEIFDTASAPPETRFVVFVDGERLKYADSQFEHSYVYLRTDGRRRLLSDNGYEYKWFSREYPLPPNAVLVPISRVGEYLPEARR